MSNPSDNNNGKKDSEPTEKIRHEPPIGSWAATARIMAEIFPDEDWDAWKDQMKEGDF